MSDSSRERNDDDPKCSASKACSITAGYYVGGGQYICWLHAMTVPGVMEAVRGQELQALKRGN